MPLKIRIANKPVDGTFTSNGITWTYRVRPALIMKLIAASVAAGVTMPKSRTRTNGESEPVSDIDKAREIAFYSWLAAEQIEAIVSAVGEDGKDIPLDDSEHGGAPRKVSDPALLEYFLGGVPGLAVSIGQTAFVAGQVVEEERKNSEPVPV